MTPVVRLYWAIILILLPLGRCWLLNCMNGAMPLQDTQLLSPSIPEFYLDDWIRASRETF